jgi:dipeptidase D
MNDMLYTLEPASLWEIFRKIAKIPRPSGYEEEIRAFVSDFGVNAGLETLVDEAGNVIIKKPASSGLEKRIGVVLQAHLDMVPQKTGGKVHDFRTDPVEVMIDGDWVHANGTTLGADNGIGVAAALAILESDSLQHGPLEVLLTSNEEAGMSGALGLKPGLLSGAVLLNLDSEDEGELFIGCAGGLDGTMHFSYDSETLFPGSVGFEISVSDLKGGHSGMDIHLGRGNANRIMNRLLSMGYERHELRLAFIEGGSLRNAIPRESRAVVAVPVSRKAAFHEELHVLAAILNREYADTDPELRITWSEIVVPEVVIEQGVVKRLIDAVTACPDGVCAMSPDMPGLVETSNNLARVSSCDRGRLTVECLLRSSNESAMQELAGEIGAVARSAGADCSFSGGYPGWKPDMTSPLLELMKTVYLKRFGRVPEVRAVHAGLECGIIGAAYPGLDMVSFGPTIRHPHSPDEKVECASVLKFWDFLTAILAAVPERKA